MEEAIQDIIKEFMVSTPIGNPRRQSLYRANASSLEMAGLHNPKDGLANRKGSNLLLLANPVTPAARSVESFLHKQIGFPEAN